MRSWALVITNPTTGQLWTPPGFSGISIGGGGLQGGASYGSMVNGQTLPGAWGIELDIFSTAFSNPVGNGSITIWGVSLQEVRQATNLNKFNIAIYGGMAKGLPLATAQAKYAGLLAKGMILPAFGNWIGTEMTLNLTVVPGGQTSAGGPLFGSNAQPVNLAYNWKKGTSLSQAITSLFGTAFPGVTINVNVSGNLVAPQDLPFQYNSLDQFAAWINKASRTIVNTASYGGVEIAYDPTQNAVNVFDGTVAPSSPAKQLQFQDLIGQPTWLGTGVNFKTPMRSDFKIGQTVTMPAGVNPVTTPSSSLVSLANATTSFQGNYRVTQTRHVGNSREPSADAWVTVGDAVQLAQAA